MIQANELRIGNLVHHKYIDSNDQLMTSQIRIYSPKIVEEIIKVEKINDYSINEEEYYGEVSSVYNLEQINGIPLTEEWLMNFGFEEYQYDEDGVCGFVKGVFGYINEGQFRISEGRVLFEDLAVILPLKAQIKYVHQLQNLYFALMGEELTL